MRRSACAQAREAAEKQDRSKERKQLILGYAVAGVITLAVLVGIVVAITSGGGDDGTERRRSED